MASPNESFLTGDNIGLVLAIERYDEVLRRDPRHAQTYNKRGYSRYHLGDLDGAQADYAAALAINPHYPEAYNNRGALRHTRGDYAGALADYTEALRLKPDYTQAYNNRGATYLEMRDYDRAIADFTAVLQIDPHNADAYHNRAIARDAKWDFTGNIDDCNRALELTPASPRTNARLCKLHIYRAHARYHLGDYLDFLSDYRQAFRLDRELAAHVVIRHLDILARRSLSEALAICAKHLRVHTGDYITHARQGLLLVLAGREAEAQCHFEQFWRDRPDDDAEPIAGIPLSVLIEKARTRRDAPALGQAMHE